MKDRMHNSVLCDLLQSHSVLCWNGLIITIQHRRLPGSGRHVQTHEPLTYAHEGSTACLLLHAAFARRGARTALEWTSYFNHPESQQAVTEDAHPVHWTMAKQ